MRDFRISKAPEVWVVLRRSRWTTGLQSRHGEAWQLDYQEFAAVAPFRYFRYGREMPELKIRHRYRKTPSWFMLFMTREQIIVLDAIVFSGEREVKFAVWLWALRTTELVELEASWISATGWLHAFGKWRIKRRRCIEREAREIDAGGSLVSVLMIICGGVEALLSRELRHECLVRFTILLHHAYGTTIQTFTKRATQESQMRGDYAAIFAWTNGQMQACLKDWKFSATS